MEKLRELLNSYEEYKEKETWYSNYDWRLNEINDEEEYEQWITAYRVDDSQLWVEESIAVMICKGYMFINWLVENDKIDRWKFEVEYTDKQTLKDVYIAWAKQDELLIMILAISDTPIEDLILYLK